MWNFFVLIVAVSQVCAFPADEDVRPGQVNYGLKFTFDKPADVPSSFFNSGSLKGENNAAQTSTTTTTTTTAGPPPPPVPPRALASNEPENVTALPIGSSPLSSPSSLSSPPPPPPPVPRRQARAYPACKDGSGGMCVDAGTCPANLRPENGTANACDGGQECCFGPPTTDTSCASRGGECMETGRCGSAPTFSEASDCDRKKGEICCILIN